MPTQTTIFLTTGWTLAAIGAAIVLWALFKDRARGRRRCPKCWYDMSGADGLTCPECGRTARRERRLFTTRRRWRWAAVGVLLCVAAFPLARTPQIRDEGVWGLVPIWALNAYLSLWSERAEQLWEEQFPDPWQEYNGDFNRGPILQDPTLSQFELLLLGYHGARLLAGSGVPEDWSACYCVAQLGAGARPAVSTLIHGLGRANESTDTGLRVDSEILVLAQLSQSIGSVPEQLARVVRDDPHAERRVSAAHALAFCIASGGGGNVGLLRRTAAEDPDPIVRRKVANVLKYISQ